MLQRSADRKELQEELFGLKVQKLRELCKDLKVKIGSATKAQIVGQLLSQWQLGILAEDSDEEPTVSAKKSTSVQQKLEELPPFESIQTWGKDLSALQSFIFGDLFVYLIESRDKAYDRESLKAFKSLKGYKYFDEGFVTNTWIHTIPDTDFVYARSSCFSSLTVKQTYTVYVCLNRTGTVYSAKCQCKAGLGQACSHVAAVLFRLESLKLSNTTSIPEDRTCTGKLQQWNVPSKREVQPVPVSEITFFKAEYGKTTKSKQPRINDSSSTSSQDEMANRMAEFVETVQAVCPSSGVLHFWDVADSREPTILSQDMLLQGECEKLILYNPSVPYSSQPSNDLTILSEVIEEYMEASEISPDLSTFIESITKDQANSELWKLLHNGRLTSSIFGEIIHRRETTDSGSIIRRIMGYTRMEFSTPAIQWGKDNERVNWDST